MDEIDKMHQEFEDLLKCKVTIPELSSKERKDRMEQEVANLTYPKIDSINDTIYLDSDQFKDKHEGIFRVTAFFNIIKDKLSPDEFAEYSQIFLSKRQMKNLHLLTMTFVVDGFINNINKAFKLLIYNEKFKKVFFNLRIRLHQLYKENMAKKENECKKVQKLKEEIAIKKQESISLDKEYSNAMAEVNLEINQAKADLLYFDNELININKELQKEEKELEELQIIKNNIQKDLSNQSEYNTYLQNLLNFLGHYFNAERYQISTREFEDFEKYINELIEEYKGSVRVYCRVRALTEKEYEKPLLNIKYNGENTMKIINVKSSNVGGKSKKEGAFYLFDKIFMPESSQQNIFKELEYLIGGTVEGKNLCVFAYGQTSSGKTYTMVGNPGNEATKGISIRAIEKIFNEIEIHKAKNGNIYKVNVNVYEIYNKTIRDLLVEKVTPAKNRKNLNTVEIKDMQTFIKLMMCVNKRRMTSATEKNDKSSRSHMIMQILVEGQSGNGKTYGSLNLIDLAGSEKPNALKKDNKEFKESVEINSSLTNLKTVFIALKKRAKHIPYLNSLLTESLKDYLTRKNNKTIMFVNISPLKVNEKESINSIKFGAEVNHLEIKENSN